MSTNDPPDAVPSLVAASAESRERFLLLVAEVRPRLHRYCTKMVGSSLDGEDLVQDTLAHAFFRLSTLEDERSLSPWLFRIAHNRAIDWLRRRRDPTLALEVSDEPEAPEHAETAQQVSEALTAAVIRLPPKERASVVLKDVLGHRLEEVAEIVDSTVGGVKAALHRARTKLKSQGAVIAKRTTMSPEQTQLVRAYIARFNERDWDGVQSLLRADARLELVGITELDGADAIAGNYFVNYAAMHEPWRMRLGEVDGEPVVVQEREIAPGQWEPRYALRIDGKQGQVLKLRDYVHVDYLLQDAAVDLG